MKHSNLQKKNSRYALWKNPGYLTEKQKVKPAWIVQTDPMLAVMRNCPHAASAEPIYGQHSLAAGG